MAVTGGLWLKATGLISISTVLILFSFWEGEVLQMSCAFKGFSRLKEKDRQSTLAKNGLAMSDTKRLDHSREKEVGGPSTVAEGKSHFSIT